MFVVMVALQVCHIGYLLSLPLLQVQILEIYKDHDETAVRIITAGVPCAPPQQQGISNRIP